MAELYFILEKVLLPPMSGIVDIFSRFDEYFPVSTILVSFFFVTCCYRFIIVRFLSGTPLSPMEALSDNVKAHSKSDRAGNKQKQNDKGKKNSKVVSTSHSSD